jgi:hypothetical protein
VGWHFIATLSQDFEGVKTRTWNSMRTSMAKADPQVMVVADSTMEGTDMVTDALSHKLDQDIPNIIKNDTTYNLKAASNHAYQCIPNPDLPFWAN